MHTVSIAQAKSQLSSLIHAAESGEEVVFTRHGKPVVRLVAEHPVVATESQAQREAAALDQLDAARQKLRGKVQFADWKALRDEGRRF
jgi:prevent-host-death family protein